MRAKQALLPRQFREIAKLVAFGPEGFKNLLQGGASIGDRIGGSALPKFIERLAVLLVRLRELGAVQEAKRRWRTPRRSPPRDPIHSRITLTPPSVV